MTESQSRYSIVERLTEKKLRIMSQIEDIESTVKKTKKEIVQDENAIKVWEERVIEDNKREKEDKEKKISLKKDKLAFDEEVMNDKIQNLSEQIKAIDNALEDIKSISKESNEQANK